MSRFLDCNPPESGSGFYRFVKKLEERYLPKNRILVTGPKIIQATHTNNQLSIREGFYTIVNNVTKGLNINVIKNNNRYDIRSYIQFQTGEDVSVGLNFNNPIAYAKRNESDFILEPNKIYVIKLTNDPVHDGYLMDWYNITND